MKIPVALAATGPATFVQNAQNPHGSESPQRFCKVEREKVGGGGFRPLALRPPWRSKPYASPQYVPQSRQSPADEPVQILAGWTVQHRLPLPSSGQ